MDQIRIISGGNLDATRVLLPDGTDLMKYLVGLQISVLPGTGELQATVTLTNVILGERAIPSDKDLAALGLTFSDY